MTELTKEEAHREAIRRWHELPLEERQTHLHARVFAAGLADMLLFRTMGDRRRVIEAWLITDIDPGVKRAPGHTSVNGALAIPSDSQAVSSGGDRNGTDQS